VLKMNQVNQMHLCVLRGDEGFYLFHCETKTLDCAVVEKGISCVKKGLFK